jgi:hypothetical protein
MGIQIWEDNPEFTATATSITQEYNLIGAVGMTWDQVKAALLAYAPQSNAPAGVIWQWPQRGFSLREIEATQGIWKGSVTWASLNYQYALKIGGQQQQIRSDINVVSAYPNPNLPAAVASPGYYVAGTQGACIGHDGHSVHGTSIYVPQRTWTESVEIPLKEYTFTYEDLVFGVQYSPVNGFSFRGYYPGEVLFLGMQAQLSAQNPNFVTASYEFSVSLNNSAQRQNLLTIGPIQNIAKLGWDFLDVRYNNVLDSGGQTMAAQPQYVLIHRVYYQSDFKALNIGTGTTLPQWGGKS